MEKLEVVHSAVTGQSLITEQHTGNRTDTAAMICTMHPMAKQPVKAGVGVGRSFPATTVWTQASSAEA